MAVRVVELGRRGKVVVQKKYGVTRKEFVREHLNASVPVVFGDATESWPARETFTPELFRTRFGDRTVTIHGRRYKLRDLIDLLAASSPEVPAPYPCNFQLDEVFPELVRHVEPRPSYAEPDRTNHPLLPRRFLGGAHTSEIFFGGPGGQFPYMHYDYMGLHSFINQLVGRKEFTVIPPDQSALVYPDPDNPWRSLIENHHAPDFTRYPLFAQADRVSFVVEPGETLFIPNGWWHTARSLDLTISVAFDLLGESNWPRFRAEVGALFKGADASKRVAADLYLRGLGLLLSVQERALFAL